VNVANKEAFEEQVRHIYWAVDELK